MNTYDSVLPKFLSTDELREPLMKPHLDGDNVVATNGHILLIVPVLKLSGKYQPVERYPDYKNVLPKQQAYFNTPRKISVAEIRIALRGIPRIPLKVECVSCDGSGCKKCNNTGWITIPNKYQYDHVDHKINIGEAYFNPNYIEVLLDVCDVRDTQTITHQAGDERSTSQFIFDDILMLIMPVNMRNWTGEVCDENPHKIPYR